MPDTIHVDRDCQVERLDLGDGAWVDVARGWLADADALYEHLLHEVPWQTSRLFRYDHYVEERRVSSWWRPARPCPTPPSPRPRAPCNTATAHASTASA